MAGATPSRRDAAYLGFRRRIGARVDVVVLWIHKDEQVESEAKPLPRGEGARNKRDSRAYFPSVHSISGSPMTSFVLVSTMETLATPGWR